MADVKFADPRLAPLYDLFEGKRHDLEAYLGIVAEFDAVWILDVGCGTGVFALLLDERGREVIGVDPASASVEVARKNPGADKVRFLVGDATALPPTQVDLVTMTGDVAQVSLTDAEREASLQGIHAALRPGGRAQGSATCSGHATHGRRPLTSRQRREGCIARSRRGS